MESKEKIIKYQTFSDSKSSKDFRAVIKSTDKVDGDKREEEFPSFNINKIN